MRIATLGSWKESGWWKLRGLEKNFREACVCLGKELAKNGYSVIVSGDGDNRADRWIVEGVIEEAGSEKTQRPLIEVVEKVRGHVFVDSANTYPKLFMHHRRQDTWWEGICLSSVKEADAILTIGGGKGTYIMGMTSMIGKKKLVPIGSFGGASEKLLDLLELQETNKETKDRIRVLRGNWTENALKTAMDWIRPSSFPRLLIVHGRSDDWKDLKDSLQNRLHLSEPIVMEQILGEGKTLPEKFECLASQVDACIAVATPDDLGGLSLDSNFKRRARQNVWLETGWFWGVLGRNRIMILIKGDIEMPSDLQGIEIYRYSNRPSERFEQMQLFIQKVKAS